MIEAEKQSLQATLPLKLYPPTLIHVAFLADSLIPDPKLGRRFFLRRAELIFSNGIDHEGLPIKMIKALNQNNQYPFTIEEWEKAWKVPFTPREAELHHSFLRGLAQLRRRNSIPKKRNPVKEPSKQENLAEVNNEQLSETNKQEYFSDLQAKLIRELENGLQGIAKEIAILELKGLKAAEIAEKTGLDIIAVKSLLNQVKSDEKIRENITKKYLKPEGLVPAFPLFGPRKEYLYRIGNVPSVRVLGTTYTHPKFARVS